MTMRFYYFSLFSWMLYGVVSVVAIALLWGLWTKLLKLKITRPVYWLLVAAILVGPWAEELWIAYNFDRLCRKDAGVFVNKTVEVDGFYDATLRSAYELTKVGRYKFAEHPTEDRKGIERVELATVAEREKALAWYAERNPGKERPKDRSVLYPVNEKEIIAVLPNGVDAWRVTKLDKPTARYHYKRTDFHAPVVHQIKRFENVVVDVQSGEVLGRHMNYSRGPYWFFIGLDVPTIECHELKGKDVFVYPYVLKPAK
jgi:hypothetical protein